MAEERKISRTEYLQAFALYTMAYKLQQDVYRFEVEMNRVLGLEAPDFTGSRVSDGIYSNPPESFDVILGYVGLSVEPAEQHGTPGG